MTAAGTARGCDVFYQTQYTDPTTSDILMQARWYSATTGTFRSRDTYAGDLNTPVSLNRYTYAANNPIRCSDPTGRCVNIVFDTCVDNIALTGDISGAADIGTNRLGQVDPATVGAHPDAVIYPAAEYDTTGKVVGASTEAYLLLFQYTNSNAGFERFTKSEISINPGAAQSRDQVAWQGFVAAERLDASNPNRGEGLESFGNAIVEVFALATVDIRPCFNDVNSAGCRFEGAGIFPWTKLARLGRLLRFGDEAVGAGRAPNGASVFDDIAPNGAARIGDDVIAAVDDAFTHSYRYDPRLRAEGLLDPAGHNFPYSFDDVILRTNPVTQADGPLLYRVPGSIGSKDGFFEIALNTDTGTIFHRSFRGG